jgi:hypothetical protein
MLLLTGIVSIAGIWACHGFRFAATRDPNLRLDLAGIAQAGVWSDIVATDSNGRVPSREDVAAQPLPLLSRVALAADRNRLLPQAWLAGLLETYNTTRLWPCYLMGEYRRTGWWYYYPLAALFKTPLATLAAFAVAVVLVIRRMTRFDRWTIICLLAPMLIYGLAAITSRLDQGIRHVLPLYPFGFLLSGAALAELLKRSQRIGAVVLSLLSLGLIIESVAAYPNYIPFFNAAARSHRVELLGDSNLDWGQDLKLLAAWQRAHPGTKLYVSYFGACDPGYYLADYTPLPGNSGSLLSPQQPTESGVLAISASNLQGIYLEEPMRSKYRRLLKEEKPIEVVGGSIYLYNFNRTGNVPKGPSP